MKTATERVEKYISPEPNSGCWLWTGCITGAGYGWFWSGIEYVGAHRFTFEMVNPPIPRKMTLDHLCRVRSCVNPAHLEVVTYQENTLRGHTPAAANAAKIECPKGHPYDDENTYRHPTDGRRFCRTCQRDRQRLAWQQKREVVA